MRRIAKTRRRNFIYAMGAASRSFDVQAVFTAPKIERSLLSACALWAGFKSVKFYARYSVKLARARDKILCKQSDLAKLTDVLNLAAICRS